MIDVLQEKEYCLYDMEAGKIKKMYYLHFMPKLMLEGYEDRINRKWLDGIKQ